MPKILEWFMSGYSRIALCCAAALSVLWNPLLSQYNGRVLYKLTGVGLVNVQVSAYSQGVKYSSISNANGDYTVNISVSAVEGNTDVKKMGDIKVAGLEGKAQILLPQAKNIKMVVFNTLGQEILTTQEQTSTIELDTRNLSSGTYFVRLTIDGLVRRTVLGIVNGRLLSYKPMAQIPITTTSTSNPPLGKTSGVTIDSIVFTRRDMMDLVRIKPAITGTTIETIQMVAATFINVTAYGVTADSGVAPALLQNARVWIGTRNYGDSGNYVSSTNANGMATIKLPLMASVDTLFIEAAGYWQRNRLINRLTDISITDYCITNTIDLYFFETVFLADHTGSPMVNPDTGFGRVLPFYIGIPPDTMWTNYVTDAIENQIGRYSGGKFKGVITTDSTKAYGTFNWVYPYAAIGTTWLNIDYLKDPTTIKNVEITFLTNVKRNDPAAEPEISEVTKKETANSLFDQGDLFGPTTVDSTWKRSMWYAGTDRQIKTNFEPIDLTAGIIAGKLPWRYLINVIHKPYPQ